MLFARCVSGAHVRLTVAIEFQVIGYLLAFRSIAENDLVGRVLKKEVFHLLLQM